jgi:hypothetical protein
MGQEEDPGVTAHAFENVGKCEGMNLHTPKGSPTLINGLLKLQRAIIGVTTQWLEEFFI